MKIYRAVQQNWISQKFGQNKLSMYKELGLLGHNGWDFVCEDKAPLYFDVDCKGTVIKQYLDSGGGNGIDIITEDKDGIFKHRYWHLHSFNIVPGDIVESGDLIGLCDNTGRSTGTHLHRGLKPAYLDKNGNYKNTDQNNGYWGAIDQEPFMKNIFILDEIENLKKTLSVLQTQTSLLQRLVELLKLLFKLKK